MNTTNTTRMIDYVQCKASCPEEGETRFRQCARKARLDGYCSQHHPDSVEKRLVVQASRFREQQESSPWFRLFVAHQKIKSLEAEIKLLKKT